MNHIIVETERLWLKSITPAIINELFQTQTKDAIKAYLGLDDLGYDHYKDIYEKGVETHRLSIFVFLLVDKETDLPIGECGFHTWNATHRRAEVFYNMRNEAFKQKGLMREALKEVLAYGFTELNLHRVQALIAAENQPSLKLLQRYGFSFEGTMREDYLVEGKNEDSECYSLLKWEWENSKK
ncbi:GNAT family N-acetyltransferase [Flavobacterium aciduliphilum]|uniref:Ribosomal-protein-alanine N-acetyltransferase n=1 Tax=Flavobacterium aciduliphilum TaxID=1101402 RepID=A0A328YZ50_9FLAO|nr:GNAT family protein [Flavobacterium aciduliphilum]RAR75346.1 ribosomal-protein-alanine N-acetyltransferase [Flavobacterium aciduliphilum]